MMSEWWTYRPEDLLLFSPRAYWRLFELLNAELWPVQVLALAAGLVIAVVAFRPGRNHDRWIPLILAAAWTFVGWSFLWNRYATINWPIAYVAPAFALQSALLLLAGTMPKGLVFGRRGIGGRAGLFLATVGIVAYPVLPPLFGRSWSSAELFGMAPDPTAVVTLGLLLSARGRLPSILIPIPLAWCLLSGTTLLAMNDPQAWFPFLAAVIALVAAALNMIGSRSTQA
ncbi:hypothetical protein MesoLjLc_62060 [Mesorhizobium sp. L-8-10]|uniref:DUF6064 family protein n=1 Tax=unclassified Mesorhizobium TaxID=325217 RepID=UPI001934D89A|nr:MULTISPECIES: DUF6064 family protein [unclassified Mesorhizobium]BCH26288.1 hypothetical protein MesoLjLb_60730 [Mesorhizobium sp. L-8-3]BCH34276.1 hypothetical protein MesoLjLc_62060 [Mesorhizobium sp. L-8-10]